MARPRLPRGGPRQEAGFLKRLRVLVLLLLLAPVVPVAPAAAPLGEWWGPSQGMLEGWHIRVPVVVRNPGVRELTDAVVGYDLDLTRALLEAGWTSGKQGASRRLQAFELDERSVRVVEYVSFDPASPGRGLLAASPETTANVRLGFLDRTTGYNNRTQPDIHVEWVARGKFPPNAVRSFMIYADVRAYGEKPAVPYDRQAWAPLEANRWIARGTTLVGRANTLQILGLEDGTSALIEAYVGGRPVPVSVGAGSAFTNPVQLRRGQAVTLELSATPLLVRIVSDKPVIAFGGPNPVGFVPSLDGNLLGRSFTVSTTVGFAVLTPQGGARLTVTRDGSSSIFTVSPQSVRVFDGGAPVTVESDAPILVQAWPDKQARVQFTTPLGTPMGPRLLGIGLVGGHAREFDDVPRGAPPSAQPPCTTPNQFLLTGLVVVGTLDREVWLRGRDFLTGDVTLPRGDAGAVSRTSGRVTPTSPWSASLGQANVCPLLVHASEPDTTNVVDSGAMFAIGGATSLVAPFSTPLGGRNATQFLAYANVSIVALHNGTSVAIHRPGGPERPVGLAAGDLVHVPARLDEWARIETSKPVFAVPDGLGGFFAGIDQSLVVERLGAAEYRGYLVSVEPAGDAAEPMIGVAAPGKPATYKLVVKNLARDARGAGVSDTVRLAISPLPDGWSAQLSDASLRLQGGESREVTVTVMPPKDAEEGTSITLSVTASSDALPTMADRLPLVTLIRARYGVDLWLDREGGPKSRTLVFEQGQQSRLQVVVKNLASVDDRILIAATPLSPEWRTSFEASRATLIEVPLAPGEVRSLVLEVTAPPEGGSQSLLDVTATSLSDASAAAKVAAGLRMRSDARIALEADTFALEALPGEEARFRVTFRNLGSEAVGIEFNTTGSLPEGWERPHAYYGEHAIEELEGLLPGSETKLDLVAHVPEAALRGETANLHFVVRTLPRFVGDVSLRESLDLRVIVAAQHRLTTTDATGDVVADEEGRATARIALSNAGNLVETLRARPVDLPLGSSFASGAPVVIPRGQNGSLTVALHLPPTAPAGAYRADLELVADDGATFPWRVNVTLLPRARVELGADTPQQSIAGVPTLAMLQVRNIGNVPLALPPQLVLPEGWRLSWGEVPLRELPPGGSTSLPVEVHVPRTAGDGRAEIRSDPQWADAGRLAWDVQTVRLRVEVLDRPSPTLRVQNEGTGDARDVVVELVDGGVPRDQVVLRRIPPGGSSLAVLVPPPGGSRDVTLRVDAEARYADAPAEVPVRVEGERELPLPAWTALAALLIGVFLPRRRR